MYTFGLDTDTQLDTYMIMRSDRIVVCFVVYYIELTTTVQWWT